MNIILSPHFDDAVLSLGGLLAQEGHDTLVATFFAGTPATPLITRWDAKCGFANSTEAMRARGEENARSLSTFGVHTTNIRNYSYLEKEYRSALDISSVGDIQKEIERDILALMHEFSGSSIAIFMPGFESHADHQLVKKAALSAAAVVSPQQSSAFFLYQDIPYAFTWLEKERARFLWNFFTRKNPNTWNYSSLEQAITHGHFPVRVNVRPLNADQMQKKIEGIACYASQVSRLGENLLTTVQQFASSQSRFHALHSPYAEVTYEVLPVHA